MTNRNQIFPSRFYSLDVMRGLTAFTVVLWHWQHFFFKGTKLGPVDVKQFPVFNWVFLFYSQVDLAVYLFFTLSGFIFYWRYSKQVAEGAVAFDHFLLLRFSRLYPLHFATLLLVAFGQFWMMRTEGSYFVYPANDAKHFFLSLFLASSWGLESGHSFNAPVWAVSVEVFLYTFFFLCCRFIPVRARLLAVLSLTGFLLLRKIYAPIGLSMGSFFLGGCVFLVYRRAVTSGDTVRAARWAAGLLAIALAIYLPVVIFLSRYYTAHPEAANAMLSFSSVPFLGRFDLLLQWVVPKVFHLWPTVVLFPLIILSLALTETHRGPLGKRFSFLGDISYSLYLLHFPLQLLAVVLIAQFGIDHSIYYSSWFMALFFSGLLLLSYVSYHYFETPVLQFLRRKTQPRRLNGAGGPPHPPSSLERPNGTYLAGVKHVLRKLPKVGTRK